MEGFSVFRILMTSIKKNLLLIVICIALQVIIGIIISDTYLLLCNTIHNNGNWISSKTKLENGVIGAYSFVLERQALAKGHLNLGAWHGFQEVLYKDKLYVEEIAFDFLLEPVQVAS